MLSGGGFSQPCLRASSSQFLEEHRNLDEWPDLDEDFADEFIDPHDISEGGT